jgi:anti-sigma B factor antagonist
MRCITDRQVEDVTVLELGSPEGFGELESEVSDRIKSLTREGRNRFVLNLQEVSYLDSRGLGDLANAHQTAAADGARVKLSNVQPRVATLLRTVNLLRFFEIFDSEEDALKSFR